VLLVVEWRQSIGDAGERVEEIALDCIDELLASQLAAVKILI
jgi:hypothetical protein